MYKTVRNFKIHSNLRKCSFSYVFLHFLMFSYIFLRFHTFQFLGTNSKDFMIRRIQKRKKPYKTVRNMSEWNGFVL